MFKSRLVAYIIDVIIIALVLNIIGVFFTRTDNYKKLNDELQTLNEKYVNNEIDTLTFINNQADIAQDLDKEQFLPNILQAFLIIGYFIILPYCNNGKTLGKRLFKIKIVSDGELDYNKLIVRALLINGLGYLLIILGTVYILPSLAYYILTTILGIIEFVIFIVSAVMIIKNKEQGLHDKLSKTKVISES